MNTFKRIFHSVSPMSVLVVILVPLLAFGLGTWALKDRANDLRQVPAAVVNLDEGATITVDREEQFVPFGRIIAGVLTQPGTVEEQTLGSLPEISGAPTTGFNWQLATEAEAQAGLASGKYAAVVVIPADFSQNLATMGEMDPQQATLIVNTNDASGLVDSLIGQAISQAVVAAFNSELSSQYLDGIYLGFNQIQAGVSTAADGASELATGVEDLSAATIKVSSAASEINQAVSDLSQGSAELSAGSAGLSQGANELSGGANQLSSGMRAFNQGAIELAGGAQALSYGASELAGGSSELSAGSQQLAAGSRQLAEGTSEFKQQTPRLVDGAQQLDSAANELALGADELSNAGAALGAANNQLANGSDQLLSGISSLNQAVNYGSGELPSLRNAANQLTAGVQGDQTGQNPGLVNGSNQLAQGLSAYVSALESTQTQLKNGLNAGVDQVFNTGTDSAASFNEAFNQISNNCYGVIVASGGDPNSPAAQEYCAGISQLNEQALPALQAALKDQVISPAIDQTFAGDGSNANPGLIPSLKQIEAGAISSAQQAPELVGAIEGLNTGINQIGDGLIELESGANELNAGLQQAAAGSNELANGLNQFKQGAAQLSAGTSEFSGGITNLASEVSRLNDGSIALDAGVRELAAGTTEISAGANRLSQGSAELAAGSNQLAAGSAEVANGLAELSQGTSELAAGAARLNAGVQELSQGSNELAAGVDEFAKGTAELAEGSKEAAKGADELAAGLDDAAAEIPTYDEAQRAKLSEASTSAVVVDSARLNEVNGGATATFPFAAAIGLWLGAFGTFLIWPALNRRFLDSAIPMWLVVVNSLLPALVVSLIQALLIMIAMAIFGVNVQSPISAFTVVIAAAVTFTLVQHMLLTVLGNKLGRVVSLLVLVLQAVTLAGILPLASAPELLQTINVFMPMNIATQGLMHTSLGGSVLTTTTVLIKLAIFSAISFTIALIASRKARLSVN